MNSRLVHHASLCALMALGTAAAAQSPAPSPPPGATPKPAADKPAAAPTPPKPGQPKPYKEVITAEAKSDLGLFTVHRIGDKIYYEIPTAALNREMLWATEIAQLPTGFGYGGRAVGSRIVRWTRRDNRVYLREVSYHLRGNGKGALQRGIAAATLEPIIMAFDVEAEGEGKSAVIEATRLLTSDVSEFSAKQALNAAGSDPGRSYVDQVKSFPRNVEARSLITFLPGPASPFQVRGQRPSDTKSITALIHYSMVLLPDQPMSPRRFDARVGYFTESFEDYGTAENRVAEREYIARYRLEKKDPQAVLSEPVQPIVYYISREVPEQWHPYIKQGVEDWQQAFEGAGFKNAIVCREAPDEQQDPWWDAEDARYSVIRWAPNAVMNAMGPHIHDPRTGEILSAHIVVWHDILRIIQQQYFVQVAPLDPQAQRLPLPEPLMGQLLRYVIAHEVGHTLGLRHNMKASSSYTCAQLRSKEFTEKYGDEASIMDYGRMNYVAQPGDGARLIPLIGPYDRFAIEWGYKAIPGARTPEEEKPELDRIASRQVTEPTLRFGGEDTVALVDPTVQTEDLASDPIEATTYGLRNIARVARLLIPATTRLGEDYSLLEETYDALLGQRTTELMHVAKLVGGVVETRYQGGRGGDVFRPVPRTQQAHAVQFLVDRALSTPRELLLPEILHRIEPAGVSDRVLNTQRIILANLLSEARIKRLEEQEAAERSKAYSVLELVTTLQQGVWSELSQAQPVVDVYRQNLQRDYLEQLKGRLSGESASKTSLRPIGVGCLRELAQQIDATLPRVKDRVTAMHLRTCRKDIERIVNPKN